MSDETIWKRLTRLFRSGPVVRHKVSSGEKLQAPQGTASAYKRELSSIYVHSLASYGQYERLARYADYCFRADSVVPTLNGNFTIKELSEQYKPGERFKVWSYDHDLQRIVIADAHSPRLKRAGEDSDLLSVNFDDGGKVVVTPDHRLMLRDGSYVTAAELAPGDRLMPFHRKDLSGKGYRWIYTTDRSRCKNGWELEHRLIVEHLIGRELTDEETVHHVDFNPSNNGPDNLKLMMVKDHRSYHAKLNNRNKLGKKSLKHSVWMLKNNPNRRDDLTFRKVFEAAVACDYNLKKVADVLNASRQLIKSKIRTRGFMNWEDLKSRRLDVEAAVTLAVVQLESKVSIETIFENHTGCNTIYQLCSRIGATEAAVKKALHDAKIIWTDLKLADDPSFEQNARYKRIQLPATELPNNHAVTSIEPVEREQVYNITVEGHHNLAVGSIVDGKLSACICSNSEMLYTPELATALNIYADEVTCESEGGHVIEIRSKNEEIKEILETLFYEILDIDFNAWGQVRSLCQNGDYVCVVDASEENGILNLLPVPINEIEREEGYDKDDPFAVRFRWLTHGNAILQNWQIIHFRLLGQDSYLPYGTSILEAARRIWRQLILIEDAMMVYRIVRSPERRVFYLDVGNIPAEDIDRHVETVKNNLNRSTIVDQTTGRVDLRYNPLPVRRDTQIPLLDGRTVTIEQLAREHEEGKQNWVYSIQDGTKKLVPGKVKWCGKNYTCDNLHRVWLDDGTYVDTAPEHPFVMRDGSSKRADELEAGDSLAAIYRDLSNRGYERVTGPDGLRVSTHVMVARDVYPTEMTAEQHPVVHHKTDLGSPNKRDNRPEHLQVMDFWAHRKYHADHCALTLNTSERLEERRIVRVAYNKSSEKRAKTSEQNKFYQKAQKMGAAYLGSELHKSHNPIRRDAQLKSWAEDKQGRSEKMRWIIPNEAMEIVFDYVKACPTIGKRELQMLISQDDELIEFMRMANGHLERDPTKISWLAFSSKLVRMGEISEEAQYSEFRSYAVTQPVPLNHSVNRVEVIAEVDDVYCMTVVGSNSEDDRHNFAVITDKSEDKSLKSMILLWNSVDENYYIPKRGAADTSRIESLPGGQFTGDIEDVQYIQSKMFSAIGIPRAYLGYDESVGSKATLAQEDVRFAKTIERIQKLYVSELNKIAVIHLYLLGFRGDDLVNFEIEMASPSTIATQQRLELWRMKLEIAGLAAEGILDKRTIYKRIFGLNDKQISEIDDGRQADKLLDMTIEAIVAPTETPDGEPPAGGGEEAPVPGEEELPSTLGGQEGGGEEEPTPPPAQNAGFTLAGAILGEDEIPSGMFDDDSPLDEVRKRPKSITPQMIRQKFPGALDSLRGHVSDYEFKIIDDNLGQTSDPRLYAQQLDHAGWNLWEYQYEGDYGSINHWTPVDDPEDLDEVKSRPLPLNLKQELESMWEIYNDSINGSGDVERGFPGDDFWDEFEEFTAKHDVELPNEIRDMHPADAEEILAKFAKKNAISWSGKPWPASAESLDEVRVRPISAKDGPITYPEAAKFWPKALEGTEDDWDDPSILKRLYVHDQKLWRCNSDVHDQEWEIWDDDGYDDVGGAGWMQYDSDPDRFGTVPPRAMTDESRNPGSEGDDASIATDKGKDLFAAGEDLGNHVFGTEKQTASDPFDKRASRRLISRPFSEAVDDLDEWLNEKIANISSLDDATLRRRR